ncbi:MAG TPA: cbb3-type cytochrome c oxidase subunit I [Anaerolineae bacterium]|nr:cbb3-type cytochrome c oxidase subunit I [Anaerolineae bacterium]
MATHTAHETELSHDGGHAHAHEHPPLSFWRKYIFSTDHKVIGIQFLFTSLFFFTLGGLLALLIRTQLAWPWAEIPGIGQLFYSEGGGILLPEKYLALMTMHGTIMIFFFIIPVLSGAFGNFLIPLMVGARDMAFPILNMMSYWVMVPAFLVLMAAFFVEGGPPAAGWTSYAPLSALPDMVPGSGTGQNLWLVSLILVGTSSIMGAINYITTIVMLRAKGMTMFRLPMTIWALFVTAVLVNLATPVLASALILLLLDRTIGTHFFLPEGGGHPVMWQHIFWFYSHPAVYIMILPAMGMASDIISCFARKPLFGYRPMVYSLMAIAGLGFIVWGHHMFISGMNPTLALAFMTSTMMIALPSAIKTFNWLGTIWRGDLHLTAPMLNALAFVSTFVIGGLTGVFGAATPVDIFIHDTYWIVGHIHYVLFGGSLFGVFAAIQYWFPKMFGRMMDDRLGRWHFVLTFISFNLVFFPMFILGAYGMPRRIADPYVYELFAPLQPLNQFMTISAYVLGAAQLLLAYNFVWALVRGPKASQNPWQANTLEWVAPSPPPHGNFEAIPAVYRGPYEYAAPEVTADFWPQWVDGVSPIPEPRPVQPAVSPASK